MCRYQQQEEEEEEGKRTCQVSKCGGASSHNRQWKKKKKIKRNTYQRVVRKVKRKARSELRISKGDWTRHGYGQSPITCNVDCKGPHDSMHVVDGKRVSFAEFSHGIEKKGLPCLIKNVCEHWPAMNGTWSDAALLQRYKDYSFKVGSDDDGYPVRMKFHHFLKYAHDPEQGLRDDSPLYIFDGSVLSEKDAKDGS